MSKSEANIDNAPDCTIENECDKNVSSSNSQSNRSADQESYDDDKWCEVEERPSGNRDTLLQESDVSEEGRRIFSFAPGEGQCFMIKTLNSYHFQKFIVVNVGLIKKTEQCLYSTAQFANQN